MNEDTQHLFDDPVDDNDDGGSSDFQEAQEYAASHTYDENWNG